MMFFLRMSCDCRAIRGAKYLDRAEEITMDF